MPCKNTGCISFSRPEITPRPLFPFPAALSAVDPVKELNSTLKRLAGAADFARPRASATKGGCATNRGRLLRNPPKRRFRPPRPAHFRWTCVRQAVPFALCGGVSRPRLPLEPVCPDVPPDLPGTTHLVTENPPGISESCGTKAENGFRPHTAGGGVRPGHARRPYLVP